ncbi:MAG: hypothetical protein Q9221_002963 [Calogaya cf. arnoldii]
MHLLPATHGLSAAGFFIAASLVLKDVVAIDPKHYPLLKRQGCTDIESKCLTVGSDPSECIDYICSSCTEVDPSISSCCKRTQDLDKAECISDNLDTDSSSGDDDSDRPSQTTFTGSSGTRSRSSSLTTTAFPAAVSNAACSSLIDKFSSCNAATPGFGYIDLWTSQAECYCYSASAYSPQSFDNPYSSCISYLETADPELYSSLTVGPVGRDIAISTPCASVGDVLKTTTANRGNTGSRTASPGTAPTTDGDTEPTAAGGSSGSSSGTSPGVAGGSPVAASGHVGVCVSIHFQ